MNFFRLYRRCVFDHTFTARLHGIELDIDGGKNTLEEEEPEEEAITDAIDFERFAEDPFAGAPASQMVTLPSCKFCN